jgi:4-carboxymuconolactone decarboxylase
MATLEERFQAAVPVLKTLGRVDADGEPVVSQLFCDLAPDQWRIIQEACFGVLWTRDVLTTRQRSIITITSIAVLRRDENLRGHILSGLDVGLTPDEILEIMLQLLFYAGAPIANTALIVADEVFKQRGIQVEPARIFDPTEDPETLYQRGLVTRSRLFGDRPPPPPPMATEPHKAMDRYVLEYLWGSVWSRPGLTPQDRVLVALAATVTLGVEPIVAAYTRGAIQLGLTQEQVEEVCFHLSFYVGVPLSLRAATVARQAIAESR